MRDLFNIRVLTLALTLLTATASFAQVPPGGPVDTARLLRDIEAAQGKITSLQSTVEMNAQNFVTTWKAVNGKEFPPPPIHSINITAFKGEKSYSETLSSSSTPPKMLKDPLYQVTLRNIYDGKQSYFTEQPKSGTENLRPALWTPMAGRSTMQGAIDRMYYIGLQNISDIIRSHSYTSITNSSSPEFGPLVGIDLDTKRVTPSDPDPDTKLHIDLAPAYGYAIVHQRYDGNDGYAEQGITKFSKVNGVFLPIAAENRQYTSNKVYSADGRMIPFRFETTHFTHTNLNHVPDSLFVVKMKTGDIVQDNTSRYRVGANGERILEWGDASTRPRKMLFGWLFMASLATLLLLGIGFLVRYQRRSNAR